MLHLFAAVLARRCNPSLMQSLRIPALYIPVPSPFPELELFIESCTRTYGLDLFRCSLPEPSASSPPLPIESVTRPTTPSPVPQASKNERSLTASKVYPVGKAKGGEGMRRALETYKEQFPHIHAILIGTRKDDPHGSKRTLHNCNALKSLFLSI